MKTLAQSYRRLARVQRWLLAPWMLVLAGMNAWEAAGPHGHWTNWTSVILWLVLAMVWSLVARHTYRVADATDAADAALQRILEAHRR